MKQNSSEKPIHGRAAVAPAEIPLRGWWDVARRVFTKLGQDNVSILSAGVAFYSMLSIFPALAAIVTLYALVANPLVVKDHFNSISGFMPPDVVNIISDQLISLASQDAQGLSVSLFIGIIAAIWSAHRAIDALVRAITVAYEEKETRGAIKMNLLTFGLTFGAIAMVVMILILLVVLPAVAAFLPGYSLVATFAPYLRWAAFVIIAIIAIALLYRSAPPRRPAKWRWLSLGAVLATFFWLSGSLAFSVYVQQFDSYNETYGTLGAIVVLLMWFYLSTYSVVLGAVINAEIEHQTAKDTTVGEDRPIGERDAYVADHVGTGSDSWR